MNVAAIIPAFEPDARLVDLVEALSQSAIPAIIVINDGSGPEFGHYFERIRRIPKVYLVKHARNCGKGAALKSGFDYALKEFPDYLGVVTADADGQHDSRDILNVAQRVCSDPSALILGVRTFGHNVPMRSRIGNQLTRAVVSVVTGQRVTDSQTGLRGIPRSMMRLLLKVPANGYEFESEMLICCQRSARPIREESIRTIYIDGNKSSHFNPVLDSLKIYFTLLRFSMASILSALLDNAVFLLALWFSFSLGVSQIAGRFASVALNYSIGRKAVFLSHQQHKNAFPKYLLLVIVSGVASYGLIRLLIFEFQLGALPAKVIAESILFIFNFFAQRQFVFRGNRTKSVDDKLDAERTTGPREPRLLRASGAQSQTPLV